MKTITKPLLILAMLTVIPFAPVAAPYPSGTPPAPAGRVSLSGQFERM